VLRERLRHAAGLTLLLAACGRHDRRDVPAPQRDGRDARWRWSLPSPQGNTLNAVASDGARALVAVGERGAAVRSDDGGATWREVDTGVRVALNGVCESGGAWIAVGEGGTVLRGAGAGWTAVTHPPAGDLDGVACRGRAVLAVGRRGDLLRSDDAGLSWRALLRRPDAVLRAVTFAPDGTAFAVGAHGLGLRLAPDGAVTPLRLGPDVPLTAVAHDGRALTAVGWRATALRCDARGDGCVPQGCAHDGDFFDLATTPEGALAVGMRGVVASLREDRCEVRLGDGGGTLYGIARGAAGEVAVGDHGLIRARVDGVWRDRVTARATALFAVWGRGPERVFAVGARGVALRSEDRGRSWHPLPTGGEHHLVAVRGVGERAVVALSGGIAALRSEDRGEHWREVPLGTERAGVGLWALSPTELVAVGARGNIARSADEGNTWQAVPSPVPSALFAVWGASRQELWAVGSRGVILRSTDGGARWAVHPSGTLADLTTVWGAARDDVYAAGKDGTVLRWNGARWSRLAVPTDRALFGVWGSGADDVYLVGSGGLVLHGTGRGARWSQETSGTDEDLLAVWGSGPGDVYAVGYAGTILHRW
jgi:photosystem II stability/assembly factor-like uncharacterized protein